MEVRQEEVALLPHGLSYVELDEVGLAPSLFDAWEVKAYEPVRLTASSSNVDHPRRVMVLHAVPSPGLGPGEALVHVELFRQCQDVDHEGQQPRTFLSPTAQLHAGRVSEVEVALAHAAGAPRDPMGKQDDRGFMRALQRRMAGKWGCNGCTLLVSFLGQTHTLTVRRLRLADEPGDASRSVDRPGVIALFTRDTRWLVDPDVGTTASAAVVALVSTDTERQIRTLFEMELRRKANFSSTNDGTGSCALLKGVAGVGKWSAAQRIAAVLRAEAIEINLASSRHNLESVLVSVQDRCKRSSNTRKLVVLRKLEVFASPPADEDASYKWMGGLSASGDFKTSSSQVLNFIDDLLPRPGLVVLGLLRQGYTLPSPFIRPPRFDHAFVLLAPTSAQRYHILRDFFDQRQLEESALHFLAEASQGYVLRDLVRLSRRMKMNARLRIQRSQREGIVPSSDEQSNPCIIREDIEAAMLAVGPSQMFELTMRPPRVEWQDVAGCDDAKRELDEAVKWDLAPKASPLLASLPRQAGILLYGPSGCGKTICAHAFAEALHLPFISIRGPELYSKYLGETEGLIRRLFERARQVAPSVIFFDEIDALAPTRSTGDTEGMGGMGQRVLSQLLNEMDGISARPGVLLLACSSRPDLLDPALLRPGRLERLVYVGPPSASARAQLLQVERRRQVPFADDVEEDRFAELTDGLTPAEILSCCREAALLALKEDRSARAVGWPHICAAVEQRRHSGGLMLSKGSLAHYSSFVRIRPAGA